MALVFFVAAVFAMPMVLLFRRLSRLRQPIRHPVSYLFLPAAALLQRWLNYFYDRRMCL